jgi:hypothetical protein
MLECPHCSEIVDEGYLLFNVRVVNNDRRKIECVKCYRDIALMVFWDSSLQGYHYETELIS